MKSDSIIRKFLFYKSKTDDIDCAVSCECPASSVKGMSDRRAPNFDMYAGQVDALLQTHPESSNEVRTALEELQNRFPLPLTEIVSEKIWGESAKLRVNNHLKSDFADAVRNIKSTGRSVNAYEEQYLRFILTHWSGWSATDPGHMSDSWVLYLQTLFRHLDGLVPILDSLVWPEEVSRLPVGYCPIEPSFFLLATREAYYMFDLEGSGLYCAGKDLEEVYLGLRECRFNGDKEGDWTPEKWSTESLDARRYFPIYDQTDTREPVLKLRYAIKALPIPMDCATENDEAADSENRKDNI
jgi:hypothetical protein